MTHEIQDISITAHDGLLNWSSLGFVPQWSLVQVLTYPIHGACGQGRVSGVCSPRVGSKGPALARFNIIKKKK